DHKTVGARHRDAAETVPPTPHPANLPWKIANELAPVFTDRHRRPHPEQPHRGVADVSVQRGRWFGERLAPATFGLAVIVGRRGGDRRDDRGRARRPDHAGLPWALLGCQRGGARTNPRDLS